MAAAFDLALVGGGLQNGLIALAVRHAEPQRRIALVEAEAAIGGNHTWCAHPHDVPAAARAWADELFVHRWPAYEVRFPNLRRVLQAEYAAIPSVHFGERVLQALQADPASSVHLGTQAVAVGEHAVTLDDGTQIAAELVVDARGPHSADISGCGFQKFLGLEIELEQPHAMRWPILMDATVEQRGGFRFIYTLPFSPTRLMVEDTCFALDAALDVAASEATLLDYAGGFGTIAAVIRRESGVLPMPWSSRFAPPQSSPLRAGYGGGWFHPATGYSLPCAVRLACHLAGRPGARAFDEDLQQLYRRHRRQFSFAQFLNRMLFGCFDPVESWNVFERFYRLPDDVIHRFYALSMTLTDRARMIAGKPPRGFSFTRALAMARGT